jgi:predicted transcriptional regulator
MYNRSRRSDRNSNSDSIEDIIEELANRAISGKKQIEQLIKDEG